jgi:phosphate-selective porin
MTRGWMALLVVFALLSAAGVARAQDGTRGGDGDASDPFAFTLGESVRLALDARLAIEARKGDAADHRDDIAKRRVGIDGTIGKRVDFAVEREIDGDQPWRDAYADLRIDKALRVRAGQFKLPFSLEETTGAKHLDFVDRSLAAAQLAPGRDVGVMAHGRVWRKRFEYEGGLFRHDGDGPSLTHVERTYGTATIAGRFSARPFASVKRSVGDLHVGVAATTSALPEGISNLRGRTALRERFFPATYWVAGRRQRTGIETRYRRGPFTVTSEYMRVVDDRRGQAIGGDDLAPLEAHGWYVAGVWRVPRAIGPGQNSRIELTARLERLGFGSGGTGMMTLNPRADRVADAHDRAATVGINWWVTRYAKVLFDAVHEQVRPADATLPATSGWAPVFSVQLGL